MKDYRIYIFMSIDKEGAEIESQVYAPTFYQAFDGMVNIFPENDPIDIVGMEDTCMPCEWSDESSFICEQN